MTNRPRVFMSHRHRGRSGVEDVSAKEPNIRSVVLRKPSILGRSSLTIPSRIRVAESCWGANVRERTRKEPTHGVVDQT
jgi:hypothetical protein